MSIEGEGGEGTDEGGEGTDEECGMSKEGEEEKGRMRDE